MTNAVTSRPSTIPNTAIAAEILEAVRQCGVGDPSGAWSWLRQNKQSALVDALLLGNAEKLAATLHDFFQRDFIWGLASPADSLEHDLRVWREFTDEAPIVELASPLVGQPPGAEIEGTFVIPDAPRHDYLARQLARLSIDVPRPTILEIGGGYGGLTWFLSRRIRQRCHIDCDLPTTLAIAYYYLRVGAPGLRVHWHTGGAIDPQSADVILVPAAFREDITCGVDLACNFISLSEMARQDVEAYLRIIQANSPRYFLHHNANLWPFESSKYNHVEVMASSFPIDRKRYREVFRAISPWAGSSGRIREFLYERLA